MTVKRKPYNTYAKEFKIEAVRLMEESGRQPAEIAMQLGGAVPGMMQALGRRSSGGSKTTWW